MVEACYDSWSISSLRNHGLIACPPRILPSGGAGGGGGGDGGNVLIFEGVRIVWNTTQISRGVWKLVLEGYVFHNDEARVISVGNQTSERYVVGVTNRGAVWWELTPVGSEVTSDQLTRVEVWDGLKVARRWILRDDESQCCAPSTGCSEADCGKIITDSLVPIAQSIDELGRLINVERSVNATQSATLATQASTLATHTSELADHEGRITYLEEHGGGGEGGGDFNPDDLELTGTTQIENVNISGNLVVQGELGYQRWEKRNGTFTGWMVGDEGPGLNVVLAFCSAGGAQLYYVESRILFLGDNGSGGGYTRDIITVRCLLRGGIGGSLSYVIDDIDLTTDGNQVLPSESQPLAVIAGDALILSFSTAGGSGVNYKYQVFTNISTMNW